MDSNAKIKVSEILRKEKIPRCMCRHNQKAKLRWDLFIIFLALYNCVMIPFEFAFAPGFLESYYYKSTDYFIDCLFFFDVCINFRTTFVNQKTGNEVS